MAKKGKRTPMQREKAKQGNLPLAKRLIRWLAIKGLP